MHVCGDVTRWIGEIGFERRLAQSNLGGDVGFDRAEEAEVFFGEVLA